MRTRSFDLFLLFGEPQNPLIAFGNYEGMVFQATVSTAYKSAAALWPPATPRRFQVYELEFGQTGALASNDCQCEWDLSRFATTGAMAGSTVVTNSLDLGDGASSTLFMNNQTTEPTYTTAGNGLNLKHWGINQRGSYRWRALDDGDNIVVPAAGSTGVGLRTLSSGFASSAVGNVSFVER